MKTTAAGIWVKTLATLACVSSMAVAQPATRVPSTALPAFADSGAASTRLPAPTSSVIVVRPTGWRDALVPWIDYRTRQRYQIVEIEPLDNSSELHVAILQAVSQCIPPASAVLLCGDVARPVSNSDAGSRRRQGSPLYEILIPGAVMDTSVRLGNFTTEDLCTDSVYGDLDGDGCPELSVGRIPAKSADELGAMLSRSLAYENSAAGPWLDRIHVTAGVGGFGVLADTAIETVTRRFLTEGVPDHFHMNVTYASLSSTYCPNPFRLRESYIDRINSGGLFWVYIGHGSVTQLDHFLVRDQWLPICDELDTRRFDSPNGPPIAIMLACFTGAYDAKVDCLGERLLAQPRGPIAVIAGSRVTMPYGLSQIASEMINGCFRDRLPTLGELLLQAKRRTWVAETPLDSAPEKSGDDELPASRPDIRRRYQRIVSDMAMALSPDGHDLMLERREHVRLMNLLGDPLLRIPYPEVIRLDAPEQMEEGASVTVGVIAPVSGRLRLEVGIPRDKLPPGVSTIGAFDGSEEQLATMQRTYEASNELVFKSIDLDVRSHERNAVTIDMPLGVRGRCIIAAYMHAGPKWAVGSHRISVRKPR